MEPFLKTVAAKMLEVYGKDIHKVLFVFPNRRSGLFFQHYLTSFIKTPIFSPRISNIADFIQELSDYKVADRIYLLFLLYKNFISINNSEETFDDFHYWGEMLLNDFDDIDKYLINATQLFQNIYDLKKIEDNFDYLTEEQKTILRRFWKNFTSLDNKNNENDISPKFTEVWENLLYVYNKFRNDLIKEGLGYEGMIFREVATQLKNSNIDDKLPVKIVFVGLNAISQAEFEILSSLNKKGIADFYWDYDTEFVSDRDNKASFFREINLTNFKSQYKINTSCLHKEKPKLNLIGIPSAVGQSKYIYDILNQLIAKNDKTECRVDIENMNTAIILPDEQLLLPTLYSIPNTSADGSAIFKDINVTMGYKLNNSSIVDFMNNIFELSKNIRRNDNEIAFYHKYVSLILNHKYTLQISQNESKEIQKEIAKNNIFYVPRVNLITNPFFRLIFSAHDNWKSFSDYLKNILSFLLKFYINRPSDTHDEISVINERLENPVTSIDLETAFIIEYIKVLNKLDGIINDMNIEVNITTFIKLLKKLIGSISIPFQGEPLKGLQIMGVLETRALDFSNLIILSMNEGIFPMGKKINSFIPYALRKGFGLPTYEHQDSIFAYHFYRLISRAKNIYLLYDSRTDGLKTGEVSRYFKQIKHIYPSKFDIKENTLKYEMESSIPENIEIAKTDYVLSKLNAYKKGGDRKLSASSLNSYLNCPLQFYFMQVEKIKEIEEVEEVMEANTFGTIFHAIMEEIYKPYKYTIVSPADIEKIIKNDNKINKILIDAFQTYFFKNKKIKELTGQNYLVGEVIKKYIKKTLSHDASLGDFEYVDSEVKFNTIYTTKNGLEVNIVGSIDRVDKLKGVTRIIDYKSGDGDLTFKGISQLFDKAEKKRPKAILQVFLYALLYSLEKQDIQISPNIYFLRSIVDANAKTCVVEQEDKTKKEILNFSDIKEKFKDSLDELIFEIFNPEVPFTQTNIVSTCKWCAFKDICQR